MFLGSFSTRLGRPVRRTLTGRHKAFFARARLTSSVPVFVPYDNAVMESFFASLKQELTHHERFVDRDTARSQVFDYIESFYNRQRLHSSLDYRSPEVFESMARLTN